MALQIRRGLESQRAGITPVAGELLYTTDEKLVYIGDGATAGGILLAGGSGGDVVSDTSPQLGGNLDINNFQIVSTGNQNIILNPAGTGAVEVVGSMNFSATSSAIVANGDLNITSTGLLSIGSNANLIDADIYIVRNSYSNSPSAGLSFVQHHDTPDAVNINFYRSRGNGAATTAVQNNDDIIDLNFTAKTTSTVISSAAQLSVVVEGSPTTTNVPAKFVFSTNNGTSRSTRAELSSTGVWKVNSIENYSGTDLTLTATNVKIAGDLQINAQGDLKFADADSSNYVAFQAPDTVVSNVTWTLPAADGTNGQVLSTSGTGVLSWSTPASQSVTTSRTALPSVTTSLLTPDASDALEITGYKGYILYTVQTSDSAWVRLYSSTAARDADAIRAEGMDPVPGSGVIAEVTTAGAATILITPGVIGFSTELPPTTSIPCSIKNKSATTTAITVTLTVLQLEV